MRCCEFYGLPRNKFEASFFPPMKMVVTGASLLPLKYLGKSFGSCAAMGDVALAGGQPFE